MNPEIVEVAEMMVARFHGFSASPEPDAWEKLTAWAEPRDLLAKGSDTRIFGFNNPNPSIGSPNYGYEFWLAADGIPWDGAAAAEIAHFPGGRYLTLEFTEGDPMKLPAAWKELVRWAEGSEHTMAGHQWLEGITLEGMPSRLYLPVH